MRELPKEIMDALGILSDVRETKDLGRTAFERGVNAVADTADLGHGDEARIFIAMKGATGGLSVLAGMLSYERVQVIREVEQRKKDGPPITDADEVAWAARTLTDDSILFAALAVYASQTLTDVSKARFQRDEYNPLQSARQMFKRITGRDYADFFLHLCECHTCEGERVRLGIVRPGRK